MPYLAARPVPSTEPLPALGSFDTPVIALFEGREGTASALLRAGVLHWREVSPGVVAMAPAMDLRRRLYAAGALLVVD
ncbi:hypothetical protein [Teichococcus vastitatis]|jgi:hypothetical protein|uniref:Uncharacterized protein n=1 Tax=Teichococcus vastitatis TaxID=2307076 RepID=A0ABS9W3R8_9PROT|nr:hypothetical protein [Pseudoroseomonas vastitatis]MCI0753918.1 hypothetical protein [Pseudoroseomonas vastitatis]